jgi:hypothetical protein
MSKRLPEPQHAVPLTSSTPQQLPKKQEEFFREVLALLESEAIPFAVSGAFSLRG